MIETSFKLKKIINKSASSKIFKYKRSGIKANDAKRRTA